MLNLYLYALYATASVILAYRLLKLTKTRDLLIYSLFLLASILLFWYEHASVAIPISGVIIFNAMISSYGKKECYLFILIGALYSLFVYPAGLSLLLQSVFMGMLSGSGIAATEKTHMQESTELKRNAVQITAGVFFILLFAVNPNVGDSFMLAFVLLGSVFGNYVLSKKSSPVAKILYGFERNGVLLGSGARWLALGAIVAAAFLTTNMAIAVFSAIFIGDSLSTLVGLRFKTAKLPYNKKKSVGGTLAYFFSVLFISYFFIGPLAIAIAIIAALVESQPLHIDDNFDVALVLALLFIGLGLIGI